LFPSSYGASQRVSEHLFFQRRDKLLATLHIASVLLPLLKRTLNIVVNEANSPLFECLLTVLVELVSCTHRLVLGTHQFVSSVPILNLEFLAVLPERVDFTHELHAGFLVVKVLPATEGSLLVGLLVAGDERLEPLARSHVPLVVPLNGPERPPLLPEVQPNAHLFESVLVLGLLLHQGHCISVSVPGHL